jgi:hypothetical protein
MSMLFHRFTILSGFIIIVLIFAGIGCDGDGGSTTGPAQESPNVAGVWSLTLTTVSDTTPEPQEPGTITTLSLSIIQSGTDLGVFDAQGTSNVGTGIIDPDGNFTLSGSFPQDSIPINFTMTGTVDPTGISVTGTGTFIPMISGVPAGVREVTFTGEKV